MSVDMRWASAPVMVWGGCCAGIWSSRASRGRGGSAGRCDDGEGAVGRVDGKRPVEHVEVTVVQGLAELVQLAGDARVAGSPGFPGAPKGVAFGVGHEIVMGVPLGGVISVLLSGGIGVGEDVGRLLDGCLRLGNVGEPVVQRPRGYSQAHPEVPSEIEPITTVPAG